MAMHCTQCGERQAPEAQRERTRVDLRTVDDAVCLELLERYERAGVAVMAWDVSTDVGLPAFRVLIYDWSTDALLREATGAPLQSAAFRRHLESRYLQA